MKKDKYVLRTLRSFIAYCMENNVQPLMCVDNGNGYLYVKCDDCRVRSPLLLKKNLDFIWNEIGVLRVRLLECFQMMNLEDPTFREAVI